ncbi:hypothetical protein OPT61_g4764 [Boeremia exigua]|uniref:Uncharacterized protein n=1 Tax=Boeremia exigua TaxID=749465 RepID=A0ACC2ICX5_9PLEO|nr:hypothetical protein OPT61_g4764 [Boeremia exigua]
MVKLGALAFGLLSVMATVSAQQTVKIMPFGASIVSKCWRADLQTQLRNNGITNFNFVGTQKSSCSGADIDQDHEGHPGSQATDIAAKGNLPTWLSAVETPDVILMLLRHQRRPPRQEAHRRRPQSLRRAAGPNARRKPQDAHHLLQPAAAGPSALARRRRKGHRGPQRSDQAVRADQEHGRQPRRVCR